MNKKELKNLIKDMRDFHKEGSLTDQSLIVITKIHTPFDYQSNTPESTIYESYLIHELGEVPAKIKVSNIVVAIYLSSWDRSIFLKNGLQSYRDCIRNRML